MAWELGELIIEGKTKVVRRITNSPSGAQYVHVLSKDSITAGDGARKNVIEGKSVVANQTASSIFGLLAKVGVRTHFVEGAGDDAFIGRNCDMVPIEFVIRRLATGSFLKRNATPFAVAEGYRFETPLLEYFFKDDANHDPQVSYAQLVSARLKVGERTLEESALKQMNAMSVAIFEILERVWSRLNCTLVDMKIEFGLCKATGEVLLADVIDNDAWRVWPAGDRRLMKDKQVYRDLKDVTPEALQAVLKNFEWVRDAVQRFAEPVAKAVVLACKQDEAKAKELQAHLQSAYALTTDVRLFASPMENAGAVLDHLSALQGPIQPTALAVISGGEESILGSLVEQNTLLPTVCGGADDIERIAARVAKALAVADPLVWACLRARKLNSLFQ